MSRPSPFWHFALALWLRQPSSSDFARQLARLQARSWWKLAGSSEPRRITGSTPSSPDERMERKKEDDDDDDGDDDDDNDDDHDDHDGAGAKIQWM